MGKSKLVKVRNLWMLSGICFLLLFIIDLVDRKSFLELIFIGIASVGMFINAYNSHKKIIKDKK